MSDSGGQEALVELEIERIISGGRGFARHRGKAVFVAGALPAERVIARITAVHSGYLEAECEKVIVASPHRQQAFCRHFGECGGCTLQYIAAEAQLEYKRLAFIDSLHRIGKLSDQQIPAKIDSHGGKDTSYRGRMRFIANSGDWCLRRKESDDLVHLEECPVAACEISAIMQKRLSYPDGTQFRVLAANGRAWFSGEIASIPVLGENFQVPVDGFFQSNQAMLAESIPHICAPLPERAPLLVADLYGGYGIFSHFFSRDGVHCISVDSAGGGQNSENIQFRHMRVERWIQTNEAAGDFGVIVLDPPRAGLSTAVRSYLAGASAKQIRYLSCNPDTFARDAGDLVRAGWNISACSVYDFYPHTSHLEVFGVFQKA